MNEARQYPISDREAEVLKLISYEYTTQEIAQKLYLSKHTIDTHRKSLLIKMNAKNTAGLIRKGFQEGILELSREV